MGSRQGAACGIIGYRGRRRVICVLFSEQQYFNAIGGHACLVAGEPKHIGRFEDSMRRLPRTATSRLNALIAPVREHVSALVMFYAAG
ncbi:hypothetical protein ACVI1J_003305 [Bradyrhizobium diazoefficiens]